MKPITKRLNEPKCLEFTYFISVFTFYQVDLIYGISFSLVSESLASFLALETMCQEESLSPYRTSAVLKASQNAYKEIKGDPRRDDDSPVFFNESRRQGQYSYVSLFSYY